MANIIRLQLEERIRFYILRYPRNLERVRIEASKFAGTDVSMDVIVKIRDKFRKQQEKDVRYMIACNLAQEIVLGSQERLAKLEAMYEYWDDKEEILQSVCCSAPVEKHAPINNTHYYRCLNCNSTCGTKVVQALDLEKLKLRLIKEMRAENEHLIKFAKSMGFVANSNEDKPPASVNKNYIFVDAKEGSKQSKPVSVNSEMAVTAENLTPMEREKLLTKLDGMLEAEFVDEEKDGTIEQVGK